MKFVPHNPNWNSKISSPNTKIFKVTRKDEQLVCFSIKLNPRTSVVYLFIVGTNEVGAGLRAHLLIGVAA